jgi:hypothetical protein
MDEVAQTNIDGCFLILNAEKKGMGQLFPKQTYGAPSGVFACATTDTKANLLSSRH